MLFLIQVLTKTGLLNTVVPVPSTGQPLLVCEVIPINLPSITNGEPESALFSIEGKKIK